MTFWNDPDLRINQKYQYALDIGGIVWYIKTIKYPTFSNDVKEFSTFSGGPPNYVPGIPKVQSFSITMADVIIPKKDSTPDYDISTGAFFFYIVKYLEQSVNKSTLLMTEEPADLDINFPMTETWIQTNLEDGNSQSIGKINQIVITKYYSNKPIERIRYFKCIPTKLDLGIGDYNSDDINEISSYKKGSTEYINRTLKRAENIRLFQ